MPLVAWMDDVDTDSHQHHTADNKQHQRAKTAEKTRSQKQPLAVGFSHRLSPVLFHRSRPALPPGADTVMMG